MLPLIVLATLSFSFLILGPCSPVAPYDLSTANPPQQAKELEIFVAQTEQLPNLLPEVRSYIRWAHSDKRKTTYSLVFLHGFSATNQELSPVFENLCQQLEMNCYFPRLSGHGLGSEGLGNAKFDEWLRDGILAIKVAGQIGEKVIIAGNSTGSSIGIWAEDRFSNVAANISLSPNFRPAPLHSILGRGPLGLIMTRLIVGPYYEWTPRNELRRKYWTFKYPSHTIGTLMEMLKVTTQLDYAKVHKPILVLYSQLDNVVAAPLIEDFYSQYKSEYKMIFPTPWPEKHVFAGTASNPEGSQWTIQHIQKFLCEAIQFCGPTAPL